MFDLNSFQDREMRLTEALRLGIGVRGKTLSTRLWRARRHLPRRVRGAGNKVVQASNLVRHPKLARIVDQAALDTDFQTVEAYLKVLDRSKLRSHALLGIAACLVFNLLLLVALLLFFLNWQNLP